MNSSIFNTHEPEDPWGSAWDDSPSTNRADNLAFGGGGGVANTTPFDSQIIDSNDNINNSSTSFASPPQSFQKVYEANPNIDLTPKLEQLLSKIVDEGRLTQYQLAKLMDTYYDHSFLPASVPENFYLILGLLSLELQSPGGGDYVSLKFSQGRLPDLPDDVTAILCSKKAPVASAEARSTVDSNIRSPTKRGYRGSSVGDFLDPLNSALANTSLGDNDDDNDVESGAPDEDPILADHSSIPHPNASNSSSFGPAPDRDIIKYINDIRDEFKPLNNLKPVVSIKEVPEKEGLLFKHINYNITHELKLGMMGPAGPKKVIRRYSDFVWLLEYLLKKYPFRVIPGLPPKKFTGSSPDSQFLQKRRRGLYRFLNQLVRHPVLVHEPVVVTFLSVPTDLATWRKQAKIDNSIEFKGCKILTDFIEKYWPAIGEEFLRDWQKAERDITKLIETWTKIVLLIERHEKRQQQISYDNQKFSEMLTKFQNNNISIYPITGTNSNSTTNNEGQKTIIASTNNDDISSLNESISALSGFFVNLRQLLLDDSFSINSGLLEKFKSYLDYLYLLQELFERLKTLSGNNIAELQKRIQETEQHYTKLSNEDVDIKGSDIAKLRQKIVNDKRELFQQLNRDWLIKECCFREFLMFQETQYLISEMWVDWAKGRNQFQQKLVGLQENIYERVSADMPSK